MAFVRKRDPRYTPNTQTADEKAKAQRDARKAQAARARAAQMAKLEQEAQELPSWATAQPDDEAEEESEEEIEEEHYECVACNKTFKSERQYDAHEKSKKHQKAIQALKRKMQKDNAHLNLDQDAIDSDVIVPADDDLGVDMSASDTNGLDESVDDLAEKTGDLKVDDLTDESQDDDHIPLKPDTTTQTKVTSEEEDDEEDEDDEYASRADVEARFAFTDSSTTRGETPATESTLVDDAESLTPAVPKMGMAAQRRAKKAARAAETSNNTDPETAHKCTGCAAGFPSKTRLHQHLQAHPEHAALKSVPAKGKKKKGKR